MAWNRSAHESGDTFRRPYGYPINDNLDRRFANWSCSANSGTKEPNNGGGGEDYLQMTGSGVGGGMWNDLKINQPTGDDSPYRVNGYYIEYGGPEKSASEFVICCHRHRAFNYELWSRAQPT